LFLLVNYRSGVFPSAQRAPRLWRSANAPVAHGMYMPPFTCRVSPVM
jgi:hypothetical protein